MKFLLLLACVSLVSFGCRVPPTAESIANAEKKAEARENEPRLILSFVHLQTAPDNVLHITGNVTNPNSYPVDGIQPAVGYFGKEGTPVSARGAIAKLPVPPRGNSDFEILVRNPPPKPAYVIDFIDTNGEEVPFTNLAGPIDERATYGSANR